MIQDVWPLVRAKTMQALDRHTIQQLGVPGEILMESAGRAVTEAVLARRPREGSVLVVCGAGNNGGDGLVVARQLHVLGVPVRVALVGDAKKLRGDAAANFKRAKALGIEITDASKRFAPASVIVDAIFGTGLAREVEGAPAAAIRRINAARHAACVVAVDLPSGVNADTGVEHGTAVRADITVTFGLPKVGLTLEPGRNLAGDIYVARIGIVDEAPKAVPDAMLFTHAGAGARLPARPPDAHKGSFGHVLVVAGSEGKTGAAALAAEAAGRSGAGLVTVACPAGLNDVLELKCTEAMTAPVADTPARAFAASAEAAITTLAAERDVVALGPGVGTAAETVKLVHALVSRIGKPLVIDADGLNCLAKDADLVRKRRAPTVLTPHPGEASRWLGTSPAELNRDRPGAAAKLAEQTGAVVLLKGAATVVAAPDGRLFVNPTGGPVLASGGTGDVLTGVVAGLIAQGVEAAEAAALAAFWHGAAAEALAERGGPAGSLAGDLVRELPATALALRETTARAALEPEIGSELALRFPES